MRISRWMQRAAVAFGLAAALPPTLAAQGVTTGAISGTITDAQGQPVEGAQVQIINRSTGYSVGSITRSTGYYFVQGLESGGPYTVRVRRIGFEPVDRNGISVTLSQTTRVDISLTAQAVQLGAVTVTGSVDGGVFSPSRQGVSTEISDTLISRLPQLNRNFTDLVKLTPQVTRSCNENSSGQQQCGSSAGGQYNRYNNFTIDGASQNDRFSLGSGGGLPGAAGGGRLISSEAVREFRVLLSPTDVRQANFTGMLVNAVTKSGTNEWHGGVMYNFRNEDFAASNFRQTKLDVKNIGFQLGGPIIQDKLHFYIAPEWQQSTTGGSGAFVGASGAATGSTLNISPDSIALVQSIVKSRLGFDPGTSGRVDIDNPLSNLFGRLDWQINNTHRAVLRQIVNKTENISFSRNNNLFNSNPANQNTGFRLGSNQFTGVNKNNSTALQLYSSFANGSSNEFIAGYNTIRDQRIVPTVTPEIAVGVVPVGATGAAATNPTAAITFGTERFSIGNRADQDITEIQNNFSLPLWSHTLTFGGRLEHVKVYNNFPQGLGGAWVFPNITALNNLAPTGYLVGYPNSGNNADIPAEFRTNQFSLYGQDQWAVTPRFTVTVGLRADVPTFQDKPPFNPLITQRFEARGMPGIRTDAVPKTRVLWSPRIGFNWDPTGDQQNQLRGNVGIFTGPPPFILLANGYQNSGLGLVTLTCTGAATPAFTIDVNALPRACRNQSPPAPNAAGYAGVNLTDPDFKYPQYFVASGGVDRQLPFGVIGSVEGLYRKAVNGVFIRDLNLFGPRMVGGQPLRDRNGRILYADTITSAGAVTNTGQRVITTTGTNNAAFSEGAIFVTNQSKDYNYSLTGKLQKRFGMGLDATAAYTYNRAFDVQSLTSDRAISNWRNGREYAGLESEATLTTSAFERRHRVVSYGTYTFPWSKWTTAISLFFEGVSGGAITYTANQDLNGDGSNTNDPIYVPRNATDPNEILIGTMTTAGVFTQDAEAASAFNAFIDSQECLDKQRGQIMERHSCRNPFQKRLDFSLRQGIPEVRGQRASVQLDILNFANLTGELMNKAFGGGRQWGKNYGATLNAFPQQQVLSGATGTGRIVRSPGPISQSQPVYSFNPTVRTRGPFDFASNIGYRMQLTFRYEF